ncbi:hypothetical protein Tco_0723834 [Tanacetum coccineum]
MLSIVSTLVSEPGLGSHEWERSTRRVLQSCPSVRTEETYLIWQVSMEFSISQTHRRTPHEWLGMSGMNKNLGLCESDACFHMQGCLLLFGGLEQAKMFFTSFTIKSLDVIGSVIFPNDERSKLRYVRITPVCSGYGRDETWDTGDNFLKHNEDPIDLDPGPPNIFDAQFGASHYCRMMTDRNDEDTHGAHDVMLKSIPNLDKDVHPSFAQARCYAEAMEDDTKKNGLMPCNDELKSLLPKKLAYHYEHYIEKCCAQDCPSSKKNIEKMDRSSIMPHAAGSLMYAMGAGVLMAAFSSGVEFAPSDRHDFWTEASLHIKEGFDRWDLDFEAWKFCFLPGQIASCLVIFFLSCSLFVAIYLDIDSKILMIVVCL